MKLIPIIKITDHFHIGIAPDKKDQKDKKGCGCLGLFIILCAVIMPFAMIKSCLNPEDTSTTESTSVCEEYSTTDTRETAEETTED